MGKKRGRRTWKCTGQLLLRWYDSGNPACSVLTQCWFVAPFDDFSTFTVLGTCLRGSNSKEAFTLKTFQSHFTLQITCGVKGVFTLCSVALKPLNLFLLAKFL